MSRAMPSARAATPEGAEPDKLSRATLASTIAERCDTCGRFLAFADLRFSKFNYVPLNEFGPEESSFTGPCCRYREGG